MKLERVESIDLESPPIPRKNVFKHFLRSESVNREEIISRLYRKFPIMMDKLHALFSFTRQLYHGIFTVVKMTVFSMLIWICASMFSGVTTNYFQSLLTFCFIVFTVDIMLEWFAFNFGSLLDLVGLGTIVDKYRHPPGPFSYPLIGTLARINPREPQRSILAWKKKFGDVFTIQMPSNTVVLCDYEVLKEAAIKQATSARPNSYLYKRFLHNEPEGNGIILSSGETWKRCRALAMKVLASHGVGNDSINRRLEFHSKKMIEAIEFELDNHGDIINPHRALAFAVMAVIFEIVLGRDVHFDDDKVWNLKHTLDQILETVQGPAMLAIDSYPCLANIIPTNKRYCELGFKLQKYFIDELELNKRIDRGEVTDEKIYLHNFLQMYIQGEKAESGRRMVNGDMDAVLSAGDLWTGGMETTLTALRWALIHLMLNQDIQETLFEEIHTIYPKRENNEISYRNREQTPYLLACIDEVLRVGNILPWNIPHRTQEEITIKGHTIPEGSNMMFSFSSLNHNEEYFPEPYVFNPERFLRRTPFKEEEREVEHGKPFLKYQSNEKFLPFGYGKRKCPGEVLAKQELYVFLINLITRYRFEVDPANPPNLVRSMGMTSTPKEYLVKITRRSM